MAALFSLSRCCNNLQFDCKDISKSYPSLWTYQDLITSQQMQYLLIQPRKIYFQNYIITCLIWRELRLPTASFAHSNIAHSVLHTRLYCTQHIAQTTLLYTAYCPQKHREFQQYHMYYAKLMILWLNGPHFINILSEIKRINSIIIIKV